MNKQQILTKAIEKAVEGGWELPTQDSDGETDFQGLTVTEGWRRSSYIVTRELTEDQICGLIFSHAFAKDFWGEETEQLEALIKKQEDGWNWEHDYRQRLDKMLPFESVDIGDKFLKAEENQNPYKLSEEDMVNFHSIGWQHHLQQMVLEEDPVGYLSKFI